MYSLVTPNRNRQDSLRRVVASWQATPLIDEIVIVDYGSNDPIRHQQFENPEKLKIVRVENSTEWCIGLAINIGVDLAASDAICKFDSDVTLTASDWLVGLDLRDGFYRGHYAHGISNGQVLFARQHWQGVGGYHEWLTDYGYDDSDFYQRLRASGAREQMLPAGMLVAEVHEHGSRIGTEIKNEFFTLQTRTPEERLNYYSLRNTYLAMLRPWNASLRRPYVARAESRASVTVELAVPSAERRWAEAIANFCALARATGVPANSKVLDTMVRRFLSERGGL
jgi:glycosyltransferase involved in cell wall biosynthesis